MNSFVDNVTEILNSQKITKNKMLTDLHLSKNSFVDWKKRGTIPSAKVVSAIAEYLGTTISTLMGYPEEEEVIDSFPQKLAFQITVSGKSISDVAQFLNLSDDTILEWLKGTDDTYNNYYEQLSSYFRVMPRYWFSPGMLSPGMEPNVEEYLLILLYRSYQETGILDPYYGELEHYFPGITINAKSHLSNSDVEWLSLIHQLPKDAQLEFRGEIKGYLKCLNETSVAADEQLKKTGTENMGK